MQRVLLAALLLAPLVAHANECKYEAPRNLVLDLSGVHAVQVETHSYDVHVTANPDINAKAANLTGRACASDPKLLDNLVVIQRREGDHLIIEAGDTHAMNLHFFGSSSTELEVNLPLPASMPLIISVGSGDGSVSGLQKVESHVGSGDLHVNDIGNLFSSSVGSGDVEAKNIGSLQLGSVGSGDFKAYGIRGDAQVGSIGSGDVTLSNVGGSVRADTLGSGDLKVTNVKGDFSVGAKGSGDVSHSGVGGKVSVPHDRD